MWEASIREGPELHEVTVCHIMEQSFEGQPVYCLNEVMAMTDGDEVENYLLQPERGCQVSLLPKEQCCYKAGEIRPDQC